MKTNFFAGENQGYGIVKFSSWKDADDAKRSVKEISGTRVQIRWDGDDAEEDYWILIDMISSLSPTESEINGIEYKI